MMHFRSMTKIVSLILAVVLTFSLCACGKEKLPYSEDLLLQDFDKYLKMDTSMCTESLAQLRYNQLEENDIRMIQTYLKNCSVVGVDGEYPEYYVKLFVPDNDAVYAAIAADVGGIGVAYESAVIGGADEAAIVALVNEYLTNVMMQGSVPLEEVSVTVSINEFGEWCSDAEVAQVILTFLKYDFVSALSEGATSEGGVADGSVPGEPAKDVSWASVAESGVFICSINGVKFQISSISIKRGGDAVSAVRAIADANSVISVGGSDVPVFVEYSVKNVSAVEGVFKNCFCFVNDGNVLENDGVAVFGLRESARLAPGEEVTMSAFKVGSKDSKLVWYSSDVVGSYIIVP